MLIPKVLSVLHNGPSGVVLLVQFERRCWTLVWAMYCRECSQPKSPPKTPRVPMMPVCSGFAMEHIVTVLWGLCTNHVLVVSDYLLVRGISLAKSRSCHSCLCLSHWVDLPVWCAVVHTLWSGRQFWEVEKTRTLPYHPQSDWVMERLNQSLLNMLSVHIAGMSIYLFLCLLIRQVCTSWLATHHSN